MSRSKKRNPGHTWCGFSQKKGKKISNKRFRRSEHMLIKMDSFLSLPVNTKELTNQYDLGGDGKEFYCPQRKNKLMDNIEDKEALLQKLLRK